MVEILDVVKDAAIVIIMAATLDQIRKGSEDRVYRLVFLILLLLM